MKLLVDIWGDLFAVGIGVLGALIKGLKKRFTASTIILGLLIAGILTFAVTGIIETFYSHLSPKIVILISFSVGWVANEITKNWIYLLMTFTKIFIEWLKSKIKRK
jgi:cell shape-determining protein MreD